MLVFFCLSILQMSVKSREACLSASSIVLHCNHWTFQNFLQRMEPNREGALSCIYKSFEFDHLLIKQGVVDGSDWAGRKLRG